MTHSSRNKLLWKKRAHCAAPRVIIPAHLSPEDQEERRKSERLIFQNLNNRLEKEKDTLKLSDIEKIKDIVCDLRKQEIAAEKVLIDRTAAQAAIDEAADARVENTENELSDDEKQNLLRDSIRRVYGLQVQPPPFRTNPPMQSTESQLGPVPQSAVADANAPQQPCEVSANSS